jgi:DnaJ-class molecular chaperone
MMTNDFKPRFLPIKCPNCNGYGTVTYEKIECHSCKGRGIVVIDQETGLIVDDLLTRDHHETYPNPK